MGKAWKRICKCNDQFEKRKRFTYSYYGGKRISKAYTNEWRYYREWVHGIVGDAICKNNQKNVKKEDFVSNQSCSWAHSNSYSGVCNIKSIKIHLSAWFLTAIEPIVVLVLSSSITAQKEKVFKQWIATFRNKEIARLNGAQRTFELFRRIETIF